MSRYSKTPTLGLGYSYGTSNSIPILRDNIAAGNIRITESVLDQGERLDILAGKYYGDSTLYWVIAAASDIGWVLQVPPGTRIVVPNLEDFKRYIG